MSLCLLSEDGLQCNASVSGLSLLGVLHWPSIRQSLCVSQSSVTACGLPKDSASSLISASPSSVEASESRSKHDGTQSWLTETASTGNCLLRPTHRCTMQSQRPCTFLYKFYSHCGGGAAYSHGRTWVGMVICTYSWLRTLK